MKTIMVTAPSSNTGKTILTLGLVKAIKNRGLDISAFKTGPDFIDTKYLEIASGKRAGNLDMHLMGREGIIQSLSMNIGDYAIIEGAMGYFDGIYNTFENSSYDISKELDIPAILIYTPKGEMFSIIPKVKGMMEFSNSKIKGIIINKTTEGIYNMIKEKMEEYLDIKILGYLPYHSSLEIESRYLGLTQTCENPNLESLINRVSEMVEKTIDIEGIIDMMKEKDIEKFKYPKKRGVDIAIAYDEAFNFYYSENLNLLENICNVKYFSPIRDKEVPNADLIYIGGGYPEIYKEELSWNMEMIKSIRNNVHRGKYIIAEAGGFMYLAKTIEDHPMCNIFDAKVHMTDRLQRFGYVNMTLNEDTILGKRGTVLTGNEYHRSTMDIDGESVFNIKKPKGKRTWQCGYMYKNVLAYYQHINFLGNKKSLEYLLDIVEKEKRDKSVY